MTGSWDKCLKMQPSSPMASGTRYQMASGKSETVVGRVQIEIENKKYAKFEKKNPLYRNKVSVLA